MRLSEMRSQSGDEQYAPAALDDMNQRAKSPYRANV
jgi:hypothetical protein